MSVYDCSARGQIYIFVVCILDAWCLVLFIRDEVRLRCRIFLHLVNFEEINSANVARCCVVIMWHEINFTWKMKLSRNHYKILATVLHRIDTGPKNWKKRNKFCLFLVVTGSYNYEID